MIGVYAQLPLGRRDDSDSGRVPKSERLHLGLELWIHIMHIHHINFVVADLDEAIGRFERILGQAVERRDALPGRGALAARFKLGGTWLVLVQPIDSEGVPGRHLTEHGEGFFLCSFGVDDLDQCLSRLQEAGVGLAGPPRQGVDNWRVQDLDPEYSLGEQFQITEEVENGD
jgi:methylmalonyl-CoA/ethylmalonyl-CoA epimerase